ncbi:hypothetical protein SDC9_58273 [bioreactor metagenome]|uniref:Uncharacterized protein n=1 Tax=bioreactor metagenome TaxID=1076179 RepID=A0A644X6X6_9ZZZZ
MIVFPAKSLPAFTSDASPESSFSVSIVKLAAVVSAVYHSVSEPPSQAALATVIHVGINPTNKTKVKKYDSIFDFILLIFIFLSRFGK